MEEKLEETRQLVARKANEIYKRKATKKEKKILENLKEKVESPLIKN